MSFGCLLLSLTTLSALTAKMPDHTGTWKFISTTRLLDPANTTHLPLDDMESVFWVFLYLALKYGNHELTGEAVGNFLMNTFDYMQSENGFYIGGRLGKGNVIKDPTLRLETEFRPKMLNTILQLMHGAFHLRYATPEWQSSDVFDEAEREDEEKEFRAKAKEHADKMKRLEDSTYLQKVIKHFTSDALSGTNGLFEGAWPPGLIPREREGNESDNVNGKRKRLSTSVAALHVGTGWLQLMWADSGAVDVRARVDDADSGARDGGNVEAAANGMGDDDNPTLQCGDGGIKLGGRQP
ncbi:uncharacterized protein STEHIDRAFT_110670 [Stereum hirsutum FP-91666 SS1]|uniref:uncharacterized protein n=1 Tax=Stereum hirsutum (strain FP-91666) TaxID=721885 RepID=UPI000440E654|nr:uncharacterized protein STEHIDRAFT_110670 [Stereum hirsutum FP-91666 SS1]EIM87458.1 hypothetical protein STEHIDRAFT_110670 [Stereum hirsutum FP-91666 SS1]